MVNAEPQILPKFITSKTLRALSCDVVQRRSPSGLTDIPRILPTSKISSGCMCVHVHNGVYVHMDQYQKLSFSSLA